VFGMCNTEYGAKGIIKKQNKVMVLEKNNGDFDLPGGRVENNESFIGCLHRELLEEVGLGFMHIEFVAYWSFMKNSELLIKGVTCVCKNTYGSIILSDEHRNFFWIKLDELHNVKFKYSYGLKKLNLQRKYRS
jgi:8-oxo-dGTP diphosphatase